jgi:thiamine biosynthesis protein ThiS
LITITVNEKTKTTDCVNVADLLRELEIKSPAIAVEVNHELVSSNRFAETELADGDSIEIVTLVGGG